jgi:hypothetical protein
VRRGFAANRKNSRCKFDRLVATAGAARAARFMGICGFLFRAKLLGVRGLGAVRKARFYRFFALLLNVEIKLKVLPGRRSPAWCRLRIEASSIDSIATPRFMTAWRDGLALAHP